MKCIYSNENSLSSLMIFKHENLSYQWISVNIHNNWRFECNTKKWTSNMHELQWLHQMFESSTWEKANEKSCLLIYDEHDSHIIVS